ncbi:RmlC-like cupin domain-containing protein [Globomyces pollinis-pini]|nr:RmlC-like cupin domain-containing protein [Globomyces pollinis-pini]
MSVIKKLSKSIHAVVKREGLGALVYRTIGTRHLRNLDPFLLLDDFKVIKPAGFPDHPHRGFETVTYMFDGVLQHEDFAGHKGSIGPGDVQWMTAGKGIMHAEMPVSDTACTGLQLWVNLPKKDKMVDPKYQELLSKNIPIVNKPGGGVTVKVIAGESYGTQAKIHTNSPIYYLDVNMEPNQSFEQVVPEGWTTFIYSITGSPIIENSKEKVDERTILIFNEHGNTVTVTSSSVPIRFVLIAGQPLKEPVFQDRLFVMNSLEETRKALEDYRNGENGFENAQDWRSSIGGHTSRL